MIVVDSAGTRHRAGVLEFREQCGLVDARDDVLYIGEPTPKTGCPDCSQYPPTLCVLWNLTAPVCTLTRVSACLWTGPEIGNTCFSWELDCYPQFHPGPLLDPCDEYAEEVDWQHMIMWRLTRWIKAGCWYMGHGDMGPPPAHIIRMPEREFQRWCLWCPDLGGWRYRPTCRSDDCLYRSVVGDYYSLATGWAGPQWVRLREGTCT